MAYAGKFIDRSPCIRPAGVDNYRKGESVGNCFFDVNVDDCREIRKKQCLNYKLPPLQGQKYAGLYTKMRSLLQPSEKINFEATLEGFRESRYSTYWNRRLGRSRDYNAQLPPRINPQTECFGIKTDTGGDMDQIIFPDKLADSTIDAETGHDLYIKTHNDYYAGEQINRKYDNPPINKNIVWGIRTKHDKAGRMVKRVMSRSDRSDTGEIQAAFLKKNERKIGKVFEPNNNIEKMPRGFRFGDTSYEERGVSDALRKDVPINEDKNHFENILKYLNSIRTMLSKRSPGFPHLDFMATLQHRDPKLKGWISMTVVCEICGLFGITITPEKLETVAQTMNIMNEEGLVDYNKFLELICPHFSLPNLKRYQGIPEEYLNYTTDYREMTTYNNSFKKTLKCLDNSAANEGIHALEAISPAIYMQYGVDYMDLFKVRSKEVIEKFYKNVGAEIPCDKFNTVWEQARKMDDKGRVCIATYNKALKEYFKDCSISL